MKKLKLGRFKVIAIVLVVTCVLLSSAAVALAGTAAPNAAVSETVVGPEFITEDEAKESYIWVATEIFGMKADKSKLTAQFNGATEYNSHESWSVTGPDGECFIDAVSGEVLMFSLPYDKKYTGKKITMEEYNTDPAYGTDLWEDPNNAYSKMATELVNAKLANGRAIDEIMIGATQFAWTNDKDGLEPSAKGTIQVDVYVLMESGRCYVFSIWGTKEIELNIFYSYPTKDACLNGYFYEDQAEDYGGGA